MAATWTAATGAPVASAAPAATVRQAVRTLRRQALSMSCSRVPGSGDRVPWATRVRASTCPSSSAATALTEVVPMSIPIVTAMRGSSSLHAPGHVVARRRSAGRAAPSAAI